MTNKISTIEDFRNNLNKMQAEFAKALPAHINADKFVRVVMTAIQNNPDILKCNRQSLYSSCMRAAQDGLLPDGREGVIVAFGEVATWLPMVAGLCKKAHNSGKLRTIDAQVVYDGDFYESWIDEEGQHFKHAKKFADRGGVLLTYAYAITKEGGFFFEEINEEQMADIEKKSKPKISPWKGPFKDEMRRKSAIRRLTKYRLPSSTDLEEIFQREDDSLAEAESQQVSLAAPAVTPSKLAKIISDHAHSDDDPDLGEGTSWVDDGGTK